MTNAVSSYWRNIKTQGRWYDVFNSNKNEYLYRRKMEEENYKNTIVYRKHLQNVAVS